jgi:hypothetical protein
LPKVQFSLNIWTVQDLVCGTVPQLGVQRGASIGEYKYSKEIDDGPINISPSKN